MNCRKKWKFLQQQFQYPADGRKGSAVCSVGFQLRDQHVTVIFENYEGTYHMLNLIVHCDLIYLQYPLIIVSLVTCSLQLMYMKQCYSRI